MESSPRTSRETSRIPREAARSRSRSRSQSRNRLDALSKRRTSFVAHLLPADQHLSVLSEQESETSARSSSPDSDSTTASSLAQSLDSIKADVSYVHRFVPVTFKTELDAKLETPALPAEFPSIPFNDHPRIVDAKDIGTPDQWLKRNEALVRLTGRHPLNCESPLPDLWDKGFITPQSHFFVRNHGPVPQVSPREADEWTFTVSGLVDNPTTFRLSDLLDPTQFQTVTLPVTLVCAGNRRKEQNMVRQSLGFSWGPAGLSTALFTGVYLADVLAKVRPRNLGVHGEEGYRRAEHVVFEGYEDLPNGKYGTSQRLRSARLKENGLMLAWAMNGQALEPDHGYPLRLVVPGQIGGRSVKWLKKIEVSDKESQHHLHFWDNKVLPTTLLPEQARAERDWWYDPRYLINDLNTNSAMAKPAHDELITVVLPVESAPPQTYTVAGYAYAGGGRRITHVELTLDAGTTWTLAEVTYPEDSYRKRVYKGDVWGSIDLTERDECFCWAFWELKVEVSKLGDAGSLAVRAIDESLHLQGKSMYWNPTGMMNNWWFRVAIHKTFDPTSGLSTLRFEHPTMPGTQSGGWMARLQDLGQDILNPIFTEQLGAEDLEILKMNKLKAKKVAIVMTKEGVDRKITQEEVSAHNTAAEPWFVVHGEVYDGTEFLKNHPGGAESINIVAGEDTSEDFMAIHSPAGQAQLAQFHIGTLIVSDVVAAVKDVNAVVVPDAQFLSKTKWKSAVLTSIELINHDSRMYKFDLEHAEQPLGLPTGQHVYVRLRRKVSPGDAEKTSTVVEGDLVQRAYTPVSGKDTKGHVELLIKVYHRTADFPEGGKMTLGFEELEVGDTVEFKGPLGSFEWLGNGVAKWRGVERNARNIGMICAGSGITPIIQVLRGVIHDVEDSVTRLWLINANKTIDDILLRKELHDLAGLVGPTRFQHHYCLSKAPEDWEHSKGRIDFAMMEKHMPPAPLDGKDDSLMLYCGPDALVDAIVKPSMLKLGWDVEKTLVVF